MTFLNRAILFLTLACCCGPLHADLVVSVTPAATTIPEGTPSVSFTLRFDATAGELDTFDAFTYVLATDDLGGGTDPAIVAVATTDFATALQDWDIVPAGPFPANVIGGNVSFLGTSTRQDLPFAGDASFNGEVLTFDVNTSSLVAGDSVSITAGPGFGFEVSDAGSPFSPSFAGATLSVAAVPEPSSFLLIGLVAAGVFSKRKLAGMLLKSKD